MGAIRKTVGLLGSIALVAASTIPTYTITSTTTSTVLACPATIPVEIVYPSWCQATECISQAAHTAARSSSVGFSDALASGSAALSAASLIVNSIVFPSTVALNPGELVIVSGITKTISASTSVTDCPCTKVISPFSTKIVYPLTMNYTGGETVVVGSQIRVIATPTIIRDCPYTKAITLTIGESYTTNVVYPKSMTCA